MWGKETKGPKRERFGGVRLARVVPERRSKKKDRLNVLGSELNFRSCFSNIADLEGLAK